MSAHPPIRRTPEHQARLQEALRQRAAEERFLEKLQRLGAPVPEVREQEERVERVRAEVERLRRGRAA